MLPQRIVSLRALLPLTVLVIASASGCRDDGGSTPSGDPAARFAEPELPDGAVSSNGTFDFVPGPAGAAPGFYVVATAEDGTTFTSPEGEVLLPAYEPPDRVADQPLSDPTLPGTLLPEVARPEGPPPRVPADALAAHDDAAVQVRLDRPVTGLHRGGSVRDRFVAPVLQTPSDAFGRARVQSELEDPDRDGVPENDNPPCTGEEDDSPECSDNCPFVSNASQADDDGDGIGDACALDYDGDGILDDGDESGTVGDTPCTGETRADCDDNCPNARNPRQRDEDGDGIGDLCDEDQDDDGTLDAEQDVDWDNDGIATAFEAGVDTDCDGVENHKDADDDGDGLATAREIFFAGGIGPDGDPSTIPDSDNDGTPDDRDSDTDGDGIPDQFEGDRDTDGDGTPDSRDPDDDGDGTPTNDEIQPDDRDPNGNLTPRWLDPTEDANTEVCTGRRARQFYPDIPTYDEPGAQLHHVSPWFLIGYGIELAGATYSWAWAIHFAPDGIYASLQEGPGIGVPPNIAGLGINAGFGLIRPPETTKLNATTVEGRSLSLSIDLLGISYGFTLFENADLVPHRAIQFDVGFGVSVDTFGISLLGFDISLALGWGRMALRTGRPADNPVFVLLYPFQDPCSVQKQSGISSFAQDIERLAALEVDSIESAFAQSIGATMLPVVQHIGELGSGSAENIPASTNGAWLDEFARRPETSPCPSCPNRSVDGLIYDTYQRMYQAGDNTAAIENAALGALFQYADSVPDRGGLDAATDFALGAVDSGFALAYSNSDRINGLPYKYVSDEIVTLEAAVGEDVPLVVTAEEVAALLPDATAADVEGATVCVLSEFSGPRAAPTCGLIEDGALEGSYTMTEATSILMAFDVDLTTAVGDFGGAPVERWTVQPSLRQIRSVAGPAAAARLNLPSEVPSGAPVTLSASLIDASGMVVSTATTFAFYGPGDELLETVNAARGAATLQLIPTPVDPTVEAAELVTVTFNDGATDDALLVVGTGLSRAGDAVLRGTSLRDSGFEPLAVSSREVLWFAPEDGELPEGGTATLQYVNPGDRATDTQDVTVFDER